MQRSMTRLAFAGIGITGLFAASQAISVNVPIQKLSAQVNAQGTEQVPTKEAAGKLLSAKMADLNKLKDRASGVTKQIGELAAKGDLPTSESGIKSLEELVQEMKQVNEALKKVQEDIEGILGWIEGQNEGLAVMTTDIINLKRVTPGNYVQFQWSDTEEDTGQVTNDGFQMRRFRMSQTNKIDDKTSMKLSFDVAAGSNRLGAELKDAMLIYDIVPSVEEVGVQLIAGQQPVPLGFELERSSGDREFPERARYNTTMFNGERDRGINFRYGVAPGLFVQAGFWQGLTVNDPQQVGVFRDTDHKVAYTVGVRVHGTQYDFGVSALVGDRPGTPASVNTTWKDNNNNGVVDPGEVTTVNISATNPADRRFLYLDGTYVGLLIPQLTLRAEAMWGRDRNPTLRSDGRPRFLSETPMVGYQAQLTFSVDSRNQLHVRYQYFDPNTNSSTGDNGWVNGWGVGYTYYLNPGVKVTVSYETFNEQNSEVKNNVITVRGQFRI